MADARHTQPASRQSALMLPVLPRRTHSSRGPIFDVVTRDRKEPLSGVVFIPAAIGCFYPPAVNNSDILQVDFDCTSVCGDGLYLVETLEGDWRGCRRFQIDGEGCLMDYSGEGDWRRIESAEATGLRVVGHVWEVYKPSLAEDARRSRLSRAARA